ncbi:PREDICTED: F-box protein At4g22390-like [Fragaria vesca subsp. vesca]
MPPRINTSRHEISKISHGFGYDSRTHDYKVVRIVRYLAWTGRKTSYEIWSLAQPSWKALSVLPPVDDFRPSSRSIFVSGAVHWVHGRVHGIWMHEANPTIVSFDMSDEVFGEITMPQVMMIKSHRIISRYRNSLAVLQWDFVLDDAKQKQLDMWVMKEYGVVESWTKLLTVKLPEYIHSIRRLGFRNNGEALIRYVNHPRARKTSRHVQKLLNPHSDDIGDFEAQGSRFLEYKLVEPFVESLILLDHPSAISTNILKG